MRNKIFGPKKSVRLREKLCKLSKQPSLSLHFTKPGPGLEPAKAKGQRVRGSTEGQPVVQPATLK